MVNLAVPFFTTLFRNWKCDSMLGFVRRSLRVSTIIGGLCSACLKPVTGRFSPARFSPSRLSSMPSKPARKSMCHQSRRNSPSVIDRRPRSSCSFTASRMLRSSVCLSFSKGISFLRTCSRISCSSRGRSRLPTWSARKGAFIAPILGLGALAPAAVGVRLARSLRVGHRADDGADFHLPVPLDRRLARAAVLLAPHQGDVGTGLGIFRLEHRDGEHLAL